MIELATAGKPHFAISRVDIDRPGPCYTVDTLRLLRAEWGPVPTFFFIVGSDSLMEMVGWRHPRQIIHLTELAVARRPGARIDLEELDLQVPGIKPRIHWVTMPGLEISSSALRQRVRTGRSISYLVPGNVESYIRENGLYVLNSPAQGEP
jgi:nicotinate-nucleotide adenylyltransferase